MVGNTGETGVWSREFCYRKDDQSVKTVDWKTMEHEADLWRYDYIRCRLLGWEMGMRLLAGWYSQSERNGETLALLRTGWI